jgi:uncharacterized protein (DUF983 family)
MAGNVDGPPSHRPDGALRVLLRGLARRCPRCGQAPLFQSWHVLHERCAVCGLDFEPDSGDTWFFMYMTTAGLTGVLLIVMLVVRPASLLLGQLLLLGGAILLIGGTLPYRKGLAVALDYLVRRNTDAPPPGA